MAMLCPACGEENRDGALACELCQTMFAPPKRPAASSTVATPTPVRPTPAPVRPTPAPVRPTPTPVSTSKPAVLFIPAAPPRRGHGGILAAGIVGAGAALLVVAVVKLTEKPKPPAVSLSAAPVEKVVYIKVPAQPQPVAAEDLLGRPSAQPPAVPAVPAAEPARATEPAHAAQPAAKRSNQITVPYRGQDARTQRILVPITVNGSATVMMAVDTGAPTTLISYGLADHLGILRSDDGKLLTSASGIGGSAPAALVVLESLTLGDAREEFVPATVTGSLSEHFQGLIGMDFITTFQLKIDAARQVLVLTKPEKNATTPGGHDERWWRRQFRRFQDQRRGWNSYRENIDRRLGESQVSEGVAIERLRRLKALAEEQAREAEKLLNRLERHASNQSVPREWR